MKNGSYTNVTLKDISENLYDVKIVIFFLVYKSDVSIDLVASCKCH